MKLEIKGKVEEIGQISTHGTGIVVDAGVRGSFFIPTSASDAVAISESGFLYQDVKITVEMGFAIL